MAAEAKKRDEQHTLVLTAIVDVQDSLTAIRDAPPSSVVPPSVNELAAMFNQSMDTMEALTRAVADSTASMTTMRARLTAAEARLENPPVQEVITPAANRSTRNSTRGSIKRGRGAGGQYISHTHSVQPPAFTPPSVSVQPPTFTPVPTPATVEGPPTFVRFLTTAEPAGLVAARNILSFVTSYPPGTISAAHGYPGSRTVFLRFRNNAAATAFVDAISNGLSGLYADSSASVVLSLPPGLSNLGN